MSFIMMSAFYGLHYDAGFMVMPAAVADYRLTGREASRRMGMHAVNLPAGRFNPAWNFIRAWNANGYDKGVYNKGVLRLPGWLSQVY